MSGSQRFDAFVSYGHGDAEWVEVLAGNLVRSHLTVSLDRWELIAGDLLAVELQQRLAVSESVVFVVSPASVAKGWVNEEFAAAIAANVRGRQRLIPVLVGEVELPPFVEGRLYIDFRNTDSPDAYLGQVAQLVRAIKGEPSADRPQPGEPLVVPGSTAYRGEGPLPARLRIDAQEAVATTAAEEATEPVTPPPGGDRAWGELRWPVQRARTAALRTPRTPDKSASTSAAGDGQESIDTVLRTVGTALGERFTPGAVGERLGAAVCEAQGSNAGLRLAVQVDAPALVDLPWETLVLPGQAMPLALTDRVQMYRAVSLPLEARPAAGSCWTTRRSCSGS